MPHITKYHLDRIYILTGWDWDNRFQCIPVMDEITVRNYDGALRYAYKLGLNDVKVYNLKIPQKRIRR